MRSFILIAAVLVFPASAFPAINHCRSEYLTIQDAIEAAVNGDTVLVAPGTCVENIDSKGKAIRIEGDQGADVTTIDGNQAGSTVTFKRGEGRNSTYFFGIHSPLVPAQSPGRITLTQSSRTTLANSSVPRFDHALRWRWGDSAIQNREHGTTPTTGGAGRPRS